MTQRKSKPRLLSDQEKSDLKFDILGQVEEMENLLKEVKSELHSFVQVGKHSAGVRIRNRLLSVKHSSSKLYNDIAPRNLPIESLREKINSSPQQIANLEQNQSQ